MGIRRLTIRECELLQGFPDGYTEGFSDTVRARMLGNAMTVDVVRFIGQNIQEFETKGEK
jgi:site-specific DNA-cytosine methylase